MCRRQGCCQHSQSLRVAPSGGLVRSCPVKNLEEVWEPVPAPGPFTTQDNADLVISLLHIIIFLSMEVSVLISYSKYSKGIGTERLQMVPSFVAIFFSILDFPFLFFFFLRFLSLLCLLLFPFFCYNFHPNILLLSIILHLKSH